MHSSMLLVLLLLAITVQVAQGSSTLSSFNVIAFSAQWPAYNGYATNLLPQNNPNANPSPFWNAALNWVYDPPYWVTFDLLAEYPVSGFEYVSIGDTTHDPYEFQISTSSSASGTYTVIGSFYGAPGTTAMQVYTLSPVITARYWKFSVLATFSNEYQACVAYFNFILPCTLWNGAPLTSGAKLQLFSPWLVAAGYPWLNYGNAVYGTDPESIMYSSTPATFTFNSISASTYPTTNGQQGLLYSPDGSVYQNDYSGGPIIAGSGGWTFALIPNPKAPFVATYVNQVNNYPGRPIGATLVNGDYLVWLGDGPDNVTLYTC